METKYKELIERVRLIDPAAAEYLEGDARKQGDFQPRRNLGSLMIWDKTPQGHDYWSNINLLLQGTPPLNWKAREQARIDNGTYEPVNLRGDDPDRFLHVSLLNPDMVAYTKNDEKGQADIQTRTTLEKYIHKFGLGVPGHVPSDALGEARALLLRAADSLQDYCAECNGDMNNWLAMEIYTWLKQTEEKRDEPNT